MTELEIIKKENQILKAQLLAVKYYIPKPVGEAEPEEYESELNRVIFLNSKYDKWDKDRLIRYIFDLLSVNNRLREKLNHHRLYNTQGWRENYLRVAAEKEILFRNLKNSHKKCYELEKELKQLKGEK